MSWCQGSPEGVAEMEGEGEEERRESLRIMKGARKVKWRSALGIGLGVERSNGAD